MLNKKLLFSSKKVNSSKIKLASNTSGKGAFWDYRTESLNDTYFEPHSWMFNGYMYELTNFSSIDNNTQVDFYSNNIVAALKITRLDTGESTVLDNKSTASSPKVNNNNEGALFTEADTGKELSVLVEILYRIGGGGSKTLRYQRVAYNLSIWRIVC